MEERPIFVPCIRWVKRGVADPVPTKIKLSKEELGEIISLSKSKFEKKNIEAKERKNKDEDEFEEKYQFRKYDEEGPDETNFHNICSDIKDPNILSSDDDGDSSDEETQIYPNDNLVLAAVIDKETSVLEVYLRNADDDDLYVHHDIVLPDYPLCLEWVGMEPMSEGARGNLCAIGSMSPVIEMWDLNIINCLEPACTLGQKPSEMKQTDRIGHEDAVLDLSWNSNLPHILGSGSADRTVLLWDLDKGSPATKISTFSEKVQALKWHPFEGFMLLTGSCDNFARVFDCRTYDTFKQWSVDGEVERVCWNHFNPFQFLVSTSTGSVYCVDCRKNDALWTTQAHSSAVTGLTLSANCPGLLATASMDSDLKVWDIADRNEPDCIAVQNSRVGSVLCLEFCPDSPFEICAGGQKRDKHFSVWNLLKESKDPEWASYNIGIFVCTRCAGIHRSLGAHISKIKHLKLDRWEDSQVERMKEVGNNASRLKYEERVPPCYRRPVPDDPQILIEQWIRAKYQREEFCYPERQGYVQGYMEGFLMKRGKEDSRYHPRKFILSESEDTLKYHVKEKKTLKLLFVCQNLMLHFRQKK